MLRDFLGDTGKYLIQKATVSLSWLLALKLYTNALSPEEFGRYSVLLAIMTYATIATGAWLSSSILRFQHADELRPIQLKETAYYLGKRAIFVGVLLFAGLLFGLRRFGWLETSSKEIFLLALSFVTSIYLQCALAFLRAKRRINLYTAASSIQILGSIAVSAVLLAFWGGGMSSVLIGGLVGLAAGIWVGRSEIIWRPKGSSAETRKMILAYGLPVVGINLFTQLLSTADQLMLKYFERNAEVGVYAASYGLSQNSLFALSSLLGASLTPLLFRAWEQGRREEASGFLKKVVILYCTFGLPFVALMALFGDLIVELLLTPEYSAGATIIPWVAGGAFLVGVANVFSEYLTLHKATLSLMAAYAIATVANIVANLWLIPTHGMIGAAWSTLGAYGVLCLAILAFYFRQRHRNEAGGITP